MATSTDPNTLIMYQGKTFRVVFTLNSGGATPVPQSLAGFGARIQILNRAGGSVLVDVNDKTTIDPITKQAYPTGDAPVVVEPNGKTGQVAIRLGADVTATITKSGVYDATIYSLTDSTEVARLASGPLTLIPVGGD